MIGNEDGSQTSQFVISPADDPISPIDYEVVSGVVEREGMISVTTPSPYNAETKIYSELMAKMCTDLTWTSSHIQVATGLLEHPSNVVGRLAITTSGTHSMFMFNGQKKKRGKS